MFGVVPATSIFGVWWAVAFTSGGPRQEFSFDNPRLQGALEFYREGQELIAEGDYKEAWDAFKTGIYSGRKVVEELQLSAPQTTESLQAAEWLVGSYVACCKASIRLNDWQTARSDAWAACMYSNNMDWKALECMLTVCQNTNDPIGTLSTLKAMRPLVMAKDGTTTTSQGPMSVEEINKKIDQIEKELEEKFNLN